MKDSHYKNEEKVAMLSVDDIMQEDNAKRMKDPQCCYEDNDMQEDNAKRINDPLYLDAEFEYD